MELRAFRAVSCNPAEDHDSAPTLCRKLNFRQSGSALVSGTESAVPS